MGCREARIGWRSSKQLSSSFLYSHPVHQRLEQMMFTYIVVGYGASKNRTWDGRKHADEDKANLSMNLVNFHDLDHVS